MFDVSILLLTRNGAATLPMLLDAIDEQDFDGRVERVAIDSGSTDRTLAVLKGRVHRLLTIAPAEFNHGETRNLGMRTSSAPLVVLVVQDAVPAGSAWLRELVAPLRADDQVAGAWSRQAPADGASAITRMHLQRWFGAAPEPKTISVDRPTFARLPPWERFEQCALDNVCSCVRRRAWEQHRFPRVPIGEDVEWARDVLLDGWRIAYAARSVVRHSHERSARYEFQRTLLIHHRLRLLFGLSTVPGLFPLVRAMAASAHAHAVCVRADDRATIGAWPRAMALSVAWPLGQYLGARFADWGVRVDGFGGV